MELDRFKAVDLTMLSKGPGLSTGIAPGTSLAELAANGGLRHLVQKNNESPVYLACHPPATPEAKFGKARLFLTVVFSEPVHMLSQRY